MEAGHQGRVGPDDFRCRQLQRPARWLQQRWRDHAWSYNSNGDSWYSDLKENCNYVRACLAFDFNTPVTKMADNWYMISRQTQTRQSDWTALSAGSTTGRTLGSAGNTTYYYVTSNLSFTNSTAGGGRRCRH